MPKQQKIKKELHDSAAERLVIAGLLQHGEESFYEINDIINSNSFHNTENRLIFTAISKLIIEQKIKKPDGLSVVALINGIDKEAVSKYSLTDYVNVICQNPVPKDNIRPFCQIIQRLYLTRTLKSKLLDAVNELDHISGEETLSQIISHAEKPIIDFTGTLLVNDETIGLQNTVSDYLDYLSKNPVDVLGIPTGFPLYDKYIGGGIRRAGVHLMGARAKIGKSFICLNIANYASSLNIPVLYLDTELTDKITMSRWISLMSGIPIDDIETGAFAKEAIVHDKVKEVSQILSQRPFYYHNIAGKHHLDWISIIRKWIMQKVGFNPNGTTKPCLIILDYIKLMDLKFTGDHQEYQYLGQVIGDLHNFAVQYDVPIFSTAQLNRDGIGGEDQGVFAGSDQLIRLCSSASILKNKSPEDYADDNIKNGNKKIIVIASRFGPGTTDGEYINVISDLSVASMKEGKTNLYNRQKKDGGNIVYDNNQDGNALII